MGPSAHGRAVPMLSVRSVSSMRSAPSTHALVVLDEGQADLVGDRVPVDAAQLDVLGDVRLDSSGSVPVTGVTGQGLLLQAVDDLGHAESLEVVEDDELLLNEARAGVVDGGQEPLAVALADGLGPYVEHPPDGGVRAARPA